MVNITAKIYHFKKKQKTCISKSQVSFRGFFLQSNLDLTKEMHVLGIYITTLSTPDKIIYKKNYFISKTVTSWQLRKTK